MEYLLLLLLIVPLYIAYVYINTGKKIKVKKTVFARQSRTLSMVNDMYNAEEDAREKTKKTQALNFFDKRHVRILIIDNEAYWIKNNAVYKAKIQDGEIDQEAAIALDTMAMDDVELKKLTDIVEQLREGLDREDSSEWDSGL